MPPNFAPVRSASNAMDRFTSVRSAPETFHFIVVAHACTFYVCAIRVCIKQVCTFLRFALNRNASVRFASYRFAFGSILRP